MNMNEERSPSCIVGYLITPNKVQIRTVTPITPENSHRFYGQAREEMSNEDDIALMNTSVIVSSPESPEALLLLQSFVPYYQPDTQNTSKAAFVLKYDELSKRLSLLTYAISGDPEAQGYLLSLGHPTVVVTGDVISTVMHRIRESRALVKMHLNVPYQTLIRYGHARLVTTWLSCDGVRYAMPSTLYWNNVHKDWLAYHSPYKIVS